MNRDPSSTTFSGLVVDSPAQWSPRRQLLLTLPPREGFSAVIEVTQDHVPLEVPLLLPRLAARRAEELWDRLPHFDALVRAEETLGGRLAERLDYTWRMGTVPMKGRHFMWLHGRDLMTVAFLDREDRFDANLSLFEEWLAGCRWTS